jgi:tetratricopeptide (TPR) repeat protein
MLQENIKEVVITLDDDLNNRVEYDEGFYSLKFQIKGETHYLELTDLMEDKAYVSEKEELKKLPNFDKMNNENVTSQFLSYFTKLQGKCFFAKYVKDQQFLVKFEYVCEEKKQVLLYACHYNADKTNELENRDKDKKLEGVSSDISKISTVTEVKEEKKTVTNKGEITDCRELIELLEKNKISQLHEKLEPKLLENPHNIKLLEIQIRAYNEQRISQKCIPICKKLIEIDNKNAIGYGEMAMALRQDKEFDKADEMVKKAIKLEPENERWYFVRGFNFNCKGRKYNDDALDECENSLQINPNYAPAMYLKGTIYSETYDKRDNALIYFDKAIMINPYDPTAWNLKGFFLKKTNKEEAIKCFKKVVEIEPSFAASYCNLADLTDTVKEKISLLEECLKVNDNFVTGMFHLARVYIANYDYSEAIKWCKKAIQINEKYSFAHNCLGEVYYLQKKYNDALPHLETAIDINEDSAKFYADYAYCLLDMDKNNANEAYDIFYMALEINPDYEYAIDGKEKAERMM